MEGQTKKQIDLIYNPYSCAAELYINGSPCLRGKGRFEDMIIGRPMEEWLEWRTVSYKRWRGFLLELMERINDDALEITFGGVESDYERLRDALEGQCAIVTEAGYADDGWTLRFDDSRYFTQEKVLNALKGIRADAIVIPPTQALLLEMKDLDAQLGNGSGLSSEQLRALMEGYVRNMQACMEKCPENQKNSWYNDIRKIEKYLK